jgi:hypothetical protein
MISLKNKFVADFKKEVKSDEKSKRKCWVPRWIDH